MNPDFLELTEGKFIQPSSICYVNFNTQMPPAERRANVFFNSAGSITLWDDDYRILSAWFDQHRS